MRGRRTFFTGRHDGITQESCIERCNEDPECHQAVFEASGPWGAGCWLGNRRSSARPTGSRPCTGHSTPCVDFCYNKEGWEESRDMQDVQEQMIIDSTPPTTPPPPTPCPNPAASDPLACCELSSDPQVCRYDALQQNTTALSWMAAHFKRTREGSCANRTCWHALSCENSGAPSTPCDFSSPSYNTSYCLPAAGFQNAKCKSLMLINCPCDGTTDIDAYFDSVMADYATRYNTEWLNRHSDAATRSAIAASNEAYLVNRSAVDLASIAKQTLGTCAERNCNNRLAASTSAASGGSSKDLDVDLEEASLVDVLFGGGAMC